jgi:DNA-directed RNA polymerase subunit RPC12/RpoP
MALIQLNCPNCHGKVEVDESLTTATCIYCQTQVLIKPPGGGFQQPVKVVVQQTAPPAKKGGCSVAAIVTVVIIVIGIAVAVSMFAERESYNPHTGAPVISAEHFIDAAQKAGYYIIIEEDYDGFGTYWAGAHLFAEGETVKKEGNEIYVIDYTRDSTIHNARVEFLLYVKNVKEFGGISNSGTGNDYEFQVNSSDTGFGIAYRIGDVNLYVTAPPDAEHKAKILAFFDAIGFGVSLE